MACANWCCQARLTLDLEAFDRDMTRSQPSPLQPWPRLCHRSASSAPFMLPKHLLSAPLWGTFTLMTSGDRPSKASSGPRPDLGLIRSLSLSLSPPPTPSFFGENMCSNPSEPDSKIGHPLSPCDHVFHVARSEKHALVTPRVASVTVVVPCHRPIRSPITCGKR